MTQPITSNKSLLSEYLSLKYEKLRQKLHQMNLLSMSQVIMGIASIFAVATYLLWSSDQSTFYTSEATILLSSYVLATSIFSHQKSMIKKVSQSIDEPTINELNKANPQLPPKYLCAVVNCDRILRSHNHPKIQEYWFWQMFRNPEIIKHEAISRLMKLGTQHKHTLINTLLPNIFDFFETRHILKEDLRLPPFKMNLIKKTLKKSPMTKAMLTEKFNQAISRLIGDLNQMKQSYPCNKVLSHAIALEINVIHENTSKYHEELINASLAVHLQQYQRWATLIRTCN